MDHSLEKSGPVARPVLRLGGIGAVIGPKATGRTAVLGNVGLAVGSNSFVAVIKAGNTNGSALFGIVNNGLGTSTKRVFRTNTRVAGAARRRHAAFLTHIFRSPGLKATPQVAITRGVLLTSGHNRGHRLVPHHLGRQVTRFAGLTTRVGGNLRGHVAAPAKTLSNKRERTLDFLVTALGQPSVLLLSRRATTLSPRATHGLLRTAGRHVARSRLATLVVARRVRSTLGCNGQLVILGSNRVGTSCGTTRGTRLAISSLCTCFRVWGGSVRGSVPW